MIPIKQLTNIVDYVWADEKRHYEEMLSEGKVKNHIFKDIKTVQCWLETLERR